MVSPFLLCFLGSALPGVPATPAPPEQLEWETGKAERDLELLCSQPLVYSRDTKAQLEADLNSQAWDSWPGARPRGLSCLTQRWPQSTVWAAGAGAHQDVHLCSAAHRLCWKRAIPSRRREWFDSASLCLFLKTLNSVLKEQGLFKKARMERPSQVHSVPLGPQQLQGG